MAGNCRGLPMRHSLPRHAELRAMAGDRRKPERCEQVIEIGQRSATDERGRAAALDRERLERPRQPLRDFDAERRCGEIKQCPINIKKHRTRSNVDCIDQHRQSPMTSNPRVQNGRGREVVPSSHPIPAESGRAPAWPSGPCFFVGEPLSTSPNVQLVWPDSESSHSFEAISFANLGIEGPQQLINPMWFRFKLAILAYGKNDAD